MNGESLLAEISRRRTFAIISHPDAGKTTLTEKLLLYGGAIQLAGSVRARRNQRATTSDWMELEKERGISISSTLLQFEYGGRVINLLDTPGHKDFSEDTYRVLTAVDSVIMVIDAAKGIEERTRKLFEICRLRGIPIFTFMNKMDRPARNPLVLLDDLEQVLGIGAFPVTWPLGSGEDFRGVYDRLQKHLHLFERTAHGQHRAPNRVSGIHDASIRAQFPDTIYAPWVEELEMLTGAGEVFDEADVMAGLITPVFFGSAMTNFGVQLLLDYYVQYGAPPQARVSAGRPVAPSDPDFSGFVFKVQANMNPRHRDRLTFVRVCSGKFEKDMVVDDPDSGKPVRLSYPQKLFGQDRESLEEAYAGDIVGLVTHKAFRIGATLTSNPAIRYDEIPRFPPEAFANIRNSGTAKYKQFREGLSQLLDEGVIQSFTMVESVSAGVLLGAVGRLQFDVVMYRLQNEYGAEPILEPAPFTCIRWISPGVPREKMERMFLGAGVRLAQDIRNQLVILFPDQWAVDYFVKEHADVGLHTVSPHATTMTD
ncbi:MAG: peptide chain release factor 3 [Lentisphaerae bacterium]|nr:peptide chain release factor 3 [Lentisphaerota bacterium]